MMPLLLLCAVALARAVLEREMPAFLADQRVGYAFRTHFALPANLAAALESERGAERARLEKQARVVCGLREHHLDDPCSSIKYDAARRACALRVHVTARCAERRAQQATSHFDATMLFLLPGESEQARAAKRAARSGEL